MVPKNSSPVSFTGKPWPLQVNKTMPLSKEEGCKAHLDFFGVSDLPAIISPLKGQKQYIEPRHRSGPGMRPMTASKLGAWLQPPPVPVSQTLVSHRGTAESSASGSGADLASPVGA